MTPPTELDAAREARDQAEREMLKATANGLDTTSIAKAHWSLHLANEALLIAQAARIRELERELYPRHTVTDVPLLYNLLTQPDADGSFPLYITDVQAHKDAVEVYMMDAEGEAKTAYYTDNVALLRNEAGEVVGFRVENVPLNSDPEESGR